MSVTAKAETIRPETPRPGTNEASSSTAEPSAIACATRSIVDCDLWQGPQSTIDLVAQAIAEGSAVLLLASFVPGLGVSGRIVSALAVTLIAAMVVHVGLILFENLIAPSPSRHHQLAVAAIRRGAFARLFWAGAIAAAFASIAVAIV